MNHKHQALRDLLIKARGLSTKGSLKIQYSDDIILGVDKITVDDTGNLVLHACGAEQRSKSADKV
jgi:hypothetical protein